jgi:hypothetical protein
MGDEESLDVGSAGDLQIVTGLIYVHAVEAGEGAVDGHLSDTKVLSGGSLVDGCTYDVAS